MRFSTTRAPGPSEAAGSGPATTGAAGAEAAAGPAPLLRVIDVAKTFGATVALRRCSLELLGGEVHALIGENGSGKSTLVKILSGVQLPDRGQILVGGFERRPWTTPRDAARAGVATVFQEVLVAGKRSVLDNVWIGSEGLLGRGLPAARRRARAFEALAALLADVPDLDAPIGTLPLSVQQIVVIARALVRNPRILILDEATSALDVASRDRLSEVVGELRARGVGVLLISHRMDEIERLADRVTVLRSGESVATLARAQATPRELVRLMTGAERLTQAAGAEVDARARGRGQVALRTRRLQLRQGARPIDVAIRRGEVVGLAGLEGHGQELFLRALRGEQVAAGGEVLRESGLAQAVLSSPDVAARQGIAYVPRDRRSESIFPTLSARENFAAPTLGEDVSRGLLRHRRSEIRLAAYVKRLAIKLESPVAPITTLSGGNQQKLLIARWLAARPDVLLLNDPTRGVDLGAKRDIYRLLRALAAEGMAVAMLSTELDELVELMDRVLVFREGELVRDLERHELSRESILAAFFGGAEDGDG